MCDIEGLRPKAIKEEVIPALLRERRERLRDSNKGN